jgi:plasmid stability protein
MKNITVTIDDETHRAARIRAAEMGTSVSALVKDYLQGLAEDAPSPSAQGVHEMPMPFSAQSTALGSQTVQAGPPWLVDGKWVYTPDGKPRKPGALRGKLVDHDESDDWKEGIIDAMYGDDTDASNTWWIEVNDVLKKRVVK